MLSSGPKSYYDEYVRKKDTERVFAKPPALLTDRNAYINFLEVQLERVSAACFAVHGHESRFNDMQGLVVSLDDKINTSTRLISVAQQGTEEVRAEFHQRAEIESNAAKSYRQESRNAIELLTSRVLQMEKIAGLLPQIEGKLNALDKRMGEYETKQRSVEQENRVANKVLQERIETLDSVKDELYTLIESTRTSVSRITFDVEENTARVNNYISGVENRIQLSLQDNKEDLQREMSALQARSTNQHEEVRRLIEVRDLELLTTTRKHHQAMQEEVEESRRRWTQDLEILAERLQTDAARRVETVQHSVSTGLQDLRASQNHQAAMMCDIEESLLNQLNSVQTHIEEVSVHQKSVEDKLQTTNKDLEEKLTELQTTLNNTTLNNTLHNTSLHHPGWGPPPFFPPAPPGTHASYPNGASFLGESFAGPGGGAPLSPVTRAADGSFNYTGNPFHGNQGNYSSSYIPPNNTGVMSFPANVSRPGTVPTSPISVHSQPQQQQQPRDGLGLGSSAQSVHTALGTHSTSNTRHSYPSHHSHQHPVSTSRPASVSRRFAQAKARSRSTSPAGITSRGAGSGAGGAPKGARKKRIESSAEVIQKFLEIYDADQQDISRRLEEMGAPPPALSKPSARKKQQQQGGSETTGEVLGNFFLNYKRDRQDILQRLSSLADGYVRTAGDVEKEGSDVEESDTEYGDGVEASGRAASQSQSQSQSQQSSPQRAHAPLYQQETQQRDGSVRSGSAQSSRVHSIPNVQREINSQSSVQEHHQHHEESETTGSINPAGRAMQSIVSQSMDEFMNTYRNRGGKRSASATKTPRNRSSASSLLHDARGGDSTINTNQTDATGDSSVHSRSRSRSTSKSPNRLRLRTGALLTSLRDGGGRDRFKRYMQMTESQSLAQSMSPNGTPGAVDISAVRWEYDNVSLKPVWKKPNTYQSPGRARTNSQGNSQSSSRAGSISPGARTASAVIDRLLRQDRYAVTHGSDSAGSARDAPVSVSVSFAAAPVLDVPPPLQTTSHATQTRGASVTVVCDCADNMSVASSVTTKTTTTSSSHHKH